MKCKSSTKIWLERRYSHAKAPLLCHGIPDLSLDWRQAVVGSAAKGAFGIGALLRMKIIRGFHLGAESRSNSPRQGSLASELAFENKMDQ